MKLVSVAGTASTRFIPGMVPHRDDADEKERQIRRYTSLLHKIARGFGFSDSEAHDLVEQVSAYARTHRAADCYPVRIWLSKVMVHTCTFRIGHELFGRSGSDGQMNQACVPANGYRYGSTLEQELLFMPLSFRATYILSHSLGFTIQEIALILNTTPANVIERYNKALAFLGQGR